MKHIFLVEDELALSNLLHTYLVEAGYKVTTFNDGLDAKASIDKAPDLWVLDIMLPGLDGYSLIKEIKAKHPNTPVIFMSARSAELDRVIGLEMGSDDYLPKPFLPRELVLRVNRLIQVDPPKTTESILQFGDSIFDRDKRVLSHKNNVYQLSVKEFDLLEFLILNTGNALSRSEMLDQVWGIDYFGSERVIDDTLRRIRKKAPSIPIETVYGYGYILKGQ